MIGGGDSEPLASLSHEIDILNDLIFQNDNDCIKKKNCDVTNKTMIVLIRLKCHCDITTHSLIALNGNIKTVSIPSGNSFSSLFLTGDGGTVKLLNYTHPLLQSFCQHYWGVAPLRGFI